MPKIEIPKALPKCELIEILAEKAGQRTDTDFNFFGRLDEFRQRVCGEARQINELFPEYTPHDEEYHLKRLFHVADTVLGRDRMEEMNSAELFVLAIALYGHDWGMAVNYAEKQYIVTGEPPEGTRSEDLWILPDERARFTKFARKQRLATDAEGCLDEITIDMWREYVRQTHSFRSGERVRRFFEPIDGGVAEAASRVCVGHRLDFEDLQDYRSYPPDLAVLRETVNLRALAVYLLLIDQLDLAEDRTPYVIWKFVAPRDPRSRMEWAKHRALRPVTCPPYQEGRIIRVDGSTDDHEVYAALEDLRIRCEEQLRGCNDLLARMNDPRHRLDLYHIDWRVAARGFEPVSIRFEFDREQMFEILGDEIYQGDPYVFLRELLQNSIDAIRMRREVLQRNGIDPGSLGVIHVTVEHGDGADAVVTWQDDGIGMDEYIVEKYLAVAGQSYYRSADFEREDLKMDPISRFGIGILSSFMVADRVEIETFKDPYLPPPGGPLRITIPAMRRQFRIEKRPEESSQVGTTIRVFVNGRRIPTDDESKPARPLDVTSYLSIVAGFVEFPIVITEGDRKTIVLHPKQDAKVARRRFGEDFEVQQLDLGYPLSESILAQDLPTAQEVLIVEAWDIASALDLEGYDGILAYPRPINEKIDFIAGHEGIDAIAIRGQAERVENQIRPSESWAGGWYDKRYIVGLSRSSNHSPNYAVYRDGILLSEASPPELLRRRYRLGLPIPRLMINLPKSRSPRVDLARTQLLGQSEHCASPVFQAHLRHLVEKSLKDLLALDPTERLYQLGRFIVFHNIEAESLWQVFPHERWPVPFLEAEGRINVLEWQEVAAETIYLVPEWLENELVEISQCQWLTQEEYEGPLVRWAGERCALLRFTGSRFSSYGSSLAMSATSSLCQFPVKKSHRLDAIRFLHPPWEGDPPLLQRILLPIEMPEELPNIQGILEKAIEDPTLLNYVERTLFYERPSRPKYFQELPWAIQFPQAFERYFAHGWSLWNLTHPVARALVRLEAAYELSERRKTLPEDQLGQLADAVESLLPRLHSFGHDYFRVFGWTENWEQFANALRRIWSMVREAQLFHIGDIEEMVPTPKEFVPGTVVKDSNSGKEMFPEYAALRQIKKIRPFGKPLT